MLAWDDHQQDILDFEWDERFKEFRKNCWEDYELLRAKAILMLRMPVTRQVATSQDGGKLIVTTIEALDWHQFMPALHMLKLSVVLAEKALGNLNIAATLLDSAGFTVGNPKAAEVSNALLNGDELEL